MKKYIVLLAFIVFPLNTFASDCDIIGSGFDSLTALNGTWTRSIDTYRGLPSFTKGSYYLAINPVAYDASLLYWIIDTTPESTGGFPYYKAYVDSEGYVGDYTHNVGGSPLEGTMTLDDCEGGGTATSTATSTDILYSDWLFVNSIIIFILSFLMWGYLWSPFKVKK